MPDLLDALPDAVVGVDAGGCIAFINDQAAKLFGYERRDLVGKTVELLLPDRLRAAHSHHRSGYQVNPTTRPMGVGLSLTARRKDGSEFPVEISLSPLETRTGAHVVSVIRDITARREIETERERLLDVAEQARDEAERAGNAIARLQVLTDAALAQLSLDGLLHELLPRIRTLLAVDEASVLFLEKDGQALRVAASEGLDEARARSVRIPLGHGFAGRVAAGREPVSIGDIDQAEVLNPALRESGIRSLLGVPLCLGDRLLGVLHVGSCKARHFAEEDVRLVQLVAERVALAANRNQLYEIESRAHAQAAEALRVRAEAERMKDDLTNMVVHDLKNPVNGIAMMVQLLLRKGALSEGQQRNLIQIQRTCREMLRLIGNVLEIAKIEAGQMPVAVERIVLAELVDEVVAEYGPVAHEVGRRLTVAVGTDLPPAVADRALLKRVLVNLVANALRHSGSTEVRIEAALEPARERIVIHVVDSGLGIPEEEQGGIFEKFKTVRGDATADTGLGPPFCKLAVERMGGRIDLRSALGTGTTFIVTLPNSKTELVGA